MAARRTGRWASAIASAVGATALLHASAASGAGPIELDFATHAKFFSEETNQPKRLDPQVFVRDRASPAAVGPQGIEHAKGFRALLVSDPADAKLYSAAGKPLGLTAGQWLGATGHVTITADPKGGADIVATFKGLKPGGVYSLFENHFDVKPVGFTPLDGNGTANSFTAKRDGSASVEVRAPEVPNAANAVLLVYHSDGKAHGESRGRIGVTAHHQRIAKIP